MKDLNLVEVMEFQAIVLAGGRGTRMDELSSTIPKCLLPIGCKPMIYYPVRMLEQAGFKGKKKEIYLSAQW